MTEKKNRRNRRFSSSFQGSLTVRAIYEIGNHVPFVILRRELCLLERIMYGSSLQGSMPFLLGKTRYMRGATRMEITSVIPYYLSPTCALVVVKLV